MQLCRRCSAPTKARNIHDVEFGGLNIILAGDFAQLPPVSGHALISLRTTDKMTPQTQSVVLGQILWHQFMTVVLLRQNMRQKEQTELDEKLRTVLENMPMEHNYTKKYRNVSVITGLNIHKDTINDGGVRSFAQDTGQEPVEFYDVDKLSARAVDRHKWSGSEHILGWLKLCVGMPVMIKENQATELFITKGREAVVVGWDSQLLVKPSRKIQIHGLPLNVVPLARKSTHVTCLLRNDSLLSLMREQVMVLPNFSMMDYGFQGKSHNPNVVHLNDPTTSFCDQIQTG
ncbi:hypothetical protein B0H10DRAFT_2160863 [Mycena sp. CBHHK59/15]|nr:hypothetical protein B0H10DRAFT_2160863 [Mycena sp. CBHHK59/15]